MARVVTPGYSPVPKVAVIGAGISGLFAARSLADHGLNVTVFEKSRGVGGRMATRRMENGSSFDHGAQYFTVRDERFRRYVHSWIEQGIVASWPNPELGTDQKIVVLKNGKTTNESKSDERFVGVPGNNSICKHLAAGLEIKKQTRVERIVDVDGSIELFDDTDNSLGAFDRLIVSAPASQSAQLLRKFTSLATQFSSIGLNPCWATMVAFENPLTDQWVGAFLHESFLSWAARNSTKPNRTAFPEHLVIHAGPEWTSGNWDRDANEVADQMLAEFWRVSGIEPQNSTELLAHRWKYAIPVEPSDTRCFFDQLAGIAVCGDWASGSRVEGAFLSGMAAAGKILGTLTPIGQNLGISQANLF